MNQLRALEVLRQAIVSHQAEELASGSIEDRLQKMRELLVQGVPAARSIPLQQLFVYCYEHGLQESNDEVFEAVCTLDPEG